MPPGRIDDRRPAPPAVVEERWARVTKMVQAYIRWILCGAFAIMPIVFVKNFGNGHSDPKWLLFFSLGIVIAVDAILRRAGTLRVVRWQGWYLAFLAVQLASFGPSANLGLFLWAVASTLTCGLLSIWIRGTEFDPRVPIALLAVAACVVIALALGMILFRAELGTSKFGSTLGMKNSVSVWLAQVLPLVLALAERSRRAPALVHALVVTLGSVSIWVILANRTRSAWWMLMVEGVLILALHVRRPEALGRTLERFIVSVVLGIALLLAVPNKLAWHSQTPYTDSLTTLASFEKSSGRDQIWRVGFAMVREHPIGGVGAGNYPVMMRRYVAPSGIDPNALAFLQPDLPVFNDYLQAVIETGVLGGLLLVVIALGLPAFAWRKVWRSSGDPWGPFCVVSCAAIAVDALVDYPFNRPETLVVHCAALALALRGDTADEWRRQIPAWLARSSQLLVAISLATITACSAGSFEIRRRATRELGSTRNLDLAYHLWPWDARWNADQARWYLKRHQVDAALSYGKSQLRHWPDDPESFLSVALAELAEGNHEAAKRAYTRAIVQVPGGRCYAAGYSSYLAAVRSLGTAAMSLPDAALRGCL